MPEKYIALSRRNVGLCPSSSLETYVKRNHGTQKNIVFLHKSCFSSDAVEQYPYTFAESVMSTTAPLRASSPHLQAFISTRTNHMKNVCIFPDSQEIVVYLPFRHTVFVNGISKENVILDSGAKW